MTAASLRRVPVIACGTPLRGDDGAGSAAVQALPGLADLPAETRLVGQLEADLLLAPGIEPCVVIDTVVGVAPGTLLSAPLHEVGRSGIGRVPHSSHSLGVARAVRLAEMVLGRPLAGRFVGVGGADFRAGAHLSEPVRDALPGLQALVLDAIAGLATPLDAPQPGAPNPGPVPPRARG